LLVQSWIAADPDIVFDKLVKIVTATGCQIKKTDRRTHTLEVSVPMSWHSYGENITFTIERTEKGASYVSVDARRKVRTNLFSHPDQTAKRIVGYLEQDCAGIDWAPEAKKLIPIRQVLVESARFLLHNPVIIVPALIFGLGDYLLARAVQAILGTVPVVVFMSPQEIAVTVLQSLIGGLLLSFTIASYTPIVQVLLSGKRPSVRDSMRQVFQRSQDLIIVGLIINLLFVIPSVTPALLDIVPLLILVFPFLWYMYTIPAMISGNLGVWRGMKASKAFGRDKKASTLYILLGVGLPGGLIVAGVPYLLSMKSAIVGQVAGFLLDVPVLAWVAIAVTYTYLVFGPAGATSSSRAPTQYCMYCGAPVIVDQRYCSNCGKQVSN
jgi:hypothetical protein